MYHHWQCTSIYRPLSYPFRSLIGISHSHYYDQALFLKILQIIIIFSKYGLALHCDGARIFNSCISQGISLETYLEDCDSASICFSKVYLITYRFMFLWSDLLFIIEVNFFGLIRFIYIN